MLKYKTFLQVFTKGALFSVIFLLGLFAFTNKSQAASAPGKWEDPQGGQCQWNNGTHITCAPVMGASIMNYADYYFDPESTLKAGHAVYRVNGDNNDLADWGYVHILDDFEIAQITNSPTDATGGYEQKPITDSGNFSNSSEEEVAGRPICGPGTDSENCTLGFTIKTTQSKNPLSRSDYLHSILVAQQGASDFFNDKASEEDCAEDAGSLGFVLCPILKTTRNAVKALIGDGTGKGFLVELLTIRPLSSTNTPELYNGWQAIRNVALGLYILVFVLIIFGNGVGYDPYTIKRALPRLAAGVVLTFASWWIMQTLVDLSNLIGNVVPAFVAQLSGNAGIADYAIDLNPALALSSVVLLIVVAFIALGALLVGIAGLIMRIVIIYGLVLLAPLAFIAWVLPNTENVFKKWWKNLIKVLMMFPIVTGMLSLSLFFQTILLNTQTDAAGNSNGVGGSAANSVTGIVGMLAPLIAIIMIPKTFKWGGEAFAAAAGYMAGKASGVGDKVANAPKTIGGKAAGSAKERALASDKVAAFTGGMAASRLGRLAGGKAAMRASGRARGRVVSEAESLTKNMTNDQLEKIASTGTQEERIAAIGQLAKRGDRKKLSGLAAKEGRTAKAYNEASSRYAGDFGKNSDLRRIGGKLTNTSDLSVEDAAGLNQDALAVGLATGSISYATAKAMYESDKVKASLSPQKMHDLTTYLNGAGYQDSSTGRTIEVQGKNNRSDTDDFTGTRTTADGRGQKVVFKGSNNLEAQLKNTAGLAKTQYDNHMSGAVDASGNRVPMNIDPQAVPLSSDREKVEVFDQPVVKAAPSGSIPKRAGRVVGQVSSRMGQGGYVTIPGGGGPGSPSPIPGPGTPPPPPPSGGAPTYTTPAGAPRYTTSGTPIPPPPSGHTPIWNGPSAPPPPPAPSPGAPPPPSSGSTPPPYRGPAPAWQPAPRQSPPPSPSSSSGSSGPASSAGGTVINNVTNNNSTTNSTTNNNSVKTVLNSNGVPSSIALGTASQLGNIKKRFSEGSAEHSGLAGIESKLNDLGRMIQSGSLSQTRLRDNVRDIHRDIDSLPPGAHDQQANLRGVLDNIERNATDDEV